MWKNIFEENFATGFLIALMTVFWVRILTASAEGLWESGETISGLNFFHLFAENYL